LAGALGRPVWILLKQVPDWRWMLDREDSPWYPTARLFRQSRAGDWDEVFTRVAAELAHFTSSRRGPIEQQTGRAVYKTNDRRAAVERRVNKLAGSALIEEKSYHPQCQSLSPSLTRHPVEAMSNRSIGESLIDGWVIFEWQISSYFGWGVYGLN